MFFHFDLSLLFLQWTFLEDRVISFYPATDLLVVSLLSGSHILWQLKISKLPVLLFELTLQTACSLRDLVHYFVLQMKEYIQSCPNFLYYIFFKLHFSEWHYYAKTFYFLFYSGFTHHGFERLLFPSPAQKNYVVSQDDLIRAAVMWICLLWFVLLCQTVLLFFFFSLF